MNAALDMPKRRVIPLSPAIAYRSAVLPQPFHTDPADQIIAAAAREENAVVLTKKERGLSIIQLHKNVPRNLTGVPVLHKVLRFTLPLQIDCKFPSLCV